MRHGRRVIGMLIAVSLVFLASSRDVSAQAPPACPAASTVTTLPFTIAKPGGSLLHAIDLLPCQTVVVVINASASSHANGLAAIEVWHMSDVPAYQSLLYSSILCGISCSLSAPASGSFSGYALPGTRGTKGLSKTFIVKASSFNWFSAPQVTYTLTIEKAPRTDYNLGGDSFASAPLITTGAVQYGSLHPFEDGQFYKIHLKAGQLIFLRGHAQGVGKQGASRNTAFTVDIYNSNQQSLGSLASVLAGYQSVSFPAPGNNPLTYTNTTGTAGDFYLKARGQAYPTQNFDFTVYTPKLTVSPATLIRGNQATFTVVDAPSATVTGWKYETLTPAVGTVDRTATPGATTWTGTIVAGGTVTVNITAQAVVTEAVQVQARQDWSFAAPSPTRLDNGEANECHTLTANSPEDGAGGDGKFSGCIVWDPLTESDVEKISDNGPNHGLNWVTAITDRTTADWVMHEDVDDPNSDWWKHQCGNWIPTNSACLTPQGTGWIRAADYAAGVERHESGFFNSHYADFKVAVEAPSNNIKTAAEDRVGGESQSTAQFVTAVTNHLHVKRTAIYTGLSSLPEPCSQTCDASCTTTKGFANTKLTGNWYLAVCPI